MDERRKYPRVNSKVKIFCKVPEEAMEQNADTVDISAGGVCLWSEKIIKPGTLLEMHVYLIGKKDPLICEGKVVRQNLRPQKAENNRFYYETGIVFENFTLTNRIAMIYYVHEKLKK